MSLPQQGQVRRPQHRAPTSHWRDPRRRRRVSTRKRRATRRDADPVHVLRDGRVAYWTGGQPGLGERKFERCGTTELAEGRATELRRHLVQIKGLGPRAWGTLDEAMQDMLIQMRAAGDPEGTTRQYKSNWNTWVPEDVGGTRCLEVGIEHWTAIFDHANAEKAGDGTILSIARTLGSLMKWGVGHGYFGTEPFGGQLHRRYAVGRARKRARIHTAERIDHFPPSICPQIADVEKFALAFEHVYPGYGYRLVILAFATGLRINELLALRHDSIDLKTNEIVVDWQLDRYAPWPAQRRPKGGKPRTGFIWSAYLEIAESLSADSLARPAGDPEYGRFFPRHRSVKAWADRAGKLAGEARDASGWDYTFHWLRHAYASYSLAPVTAGGYGFAVASVQHWLGHAKPSTTQDMYVERQANDAEIARQRSALPPGSRLPH